MDKRPNVSRIDDIYIHAYYNHIPRFLTNVEGTVFICINVDLTAFIASFSA